ncbi:biotin synthase, partial [Aduncisulcus paluster]
MKTSEREIVEEAKRMEEAGVDRFSLVSSGGYLDNSDLEKLVGVYSQISKETSLKICASHGILTEEQTASLKEA